MAPRAFDAPVWHARPASEVLEELGVHAAEGLDPEDVARRREVHGPNLLRDVEGRPWWRLLLRQVHSIVVYLLAAAMTLAFLTGRIPEGWAVLAVIVVNTGIGFVTEWRAERSMAAEQKLHLVRIHQDAGEIVAVTGDGVNDAPALKEADIGVAMGKRGTEAARQAADMILQDDRLATIVTAVEEGRVIFANIRRSTIFMLTTNVAEVLAVTAATAAGWTLPLRPLQILYLNVRTDVFPALALSVGPASGHEMEEPPRDPEEPVLTRGHWREIAGSAVILAACVLAALLVAERSLALPERQAVTVSFLTLAFGKLVYTFHLRAPRSGWWINEVTRNPWVWGALALCTALLVAAVRVPGLARLLDTAPPGAAGWGVALGLAVVPLVAASGARALRGGSRG